MYNNNAIFTACVRPESGTPIFSPPAPVYQEPRIDTRSCTTTSGPDTGSLCQFPFKWVNDIMLTF